MFHIKPPFWLGLTSTLVCAAAFGQPSPQAPAAATAVVPAPYRSALEGYRPFTDEKVQPWKESNATVEKAGGWRAYAKEVQDSSPPQSAAPSKSADSHSGHSKP